MKNPSLQTLHLQLDALWNPFNDGFGQGTLNGFPAKMPERLMSFLLVEIKLSLGKILLEKGQD